MVGGGHELTQSLIVNLDTFGMTIGPNMTGSGRYLHACAHFRHNNGSNYVIAAGGRDSSSATLTTSEILNADNAENAPWSPGK